MRAIGGLQGACRRTRSAVGAWSDRGRSLERGLYLLIHNAAITKRDAPPRTKQKKKNPAAGRWAQKKKTTPNPPARTFHGLRPSPHRRSHLPPNSPAAPTIRPVSPPRLPTPPTAPHHTSKRRARPMPANRVKYFRSVGGYGWRGGVLWRLCGLDRRRLTLWRSSDERAGAWPGRWRSTALLSSGRHGWAMDGGGDLTEEQ